MLICNPGLLALPLGGITGLVRSRPRPGVFAFATGVQWAVLGASFWSMVYFSIVTVMPPFSDKLQLAGAPFSRLESCQESPSHPVIVP